MNSGHSITKEGHSIGDAYELNRSWPETQAENRHSEPNRWAVWDGVRKPSVFWGHSRVALHGNFSEILVRRKSLGKHLRAGRLKEAIHMIGEKERTAVEDRCTHSVPVWWANCDTSPRSDSIHLEMFKTFGVMALGLMSKTTCVENHGCEIIFPTAQDPLYLWRKTIHTPK